MNKQRNSNCGRTTRRQFIRLAVAGISALGRERSAVSTTSSAVDRRLELGNPLREFGYGQISLRPGLQQTQLDVTHEVLMNLSEDSLLRPFRLRAGLRAPGCDLGGWYSTNAYGAETFGQWISALS